ncbi:MAG: glycerophosphodiester phosphodiesterase [Verrucomicrobiota bacterium]
MNFLPGTSFSTHAATRLEEGNHPLFESWIECEGTYGGHLQGVATDGYFIFWSHTVQLVKTDLTGKVLNKIDVASHHGDLTYHDGKVFVAVELGSFNRPAGESDPWVYVYDAETLNRISRHPVPALVHGCGGIAYHDKKFILVGGLPGHHQKNYLFEYDEQFQFQARHDLPTSQTRLGIQTAGYMDGHWWFGCYGSPDNPGLLKVDESFRLVGVSAADFSYGIVRLSDTIVFQGACFAENKRGKVRLLHHTPETRTPEAIKQIAAINTTQAATRKNPDLIHLNDPASIARHHPILIAHRGGIITPESHECSLTAIRLAGASHYDMIELDIQRSSDGIPMVFHDAMLEKACGKPGSVKNYRANELTSISYLNSKDSIIRFETALQTCHELGLGVMLDIKTDRDSQSFLETIDQLIVKHQLNTSTISITGNDETRRFLKHVRFTTTDLELKQLRQGRNLNLTHRFWFGLPWQLEPGDIALLKSAGVLVLPAINTFRYSAENHLEQAEADIRRLTEEGVDGFQIDSVYDSLFDK